MNDRITPEEIEAMEKRAMRHRQIMIDWLIMLIVALVALALFVPIRQGAT